VWAFDGALSIPSGDRRLDTGEELHLAWRLTTAGRPLTQHDSVCWLPAKAVSDALAEERARMARDVARAESAGDKRRLLADAHAFAVVPAAAVVGERVLLAACAQPSMADTPAAAGGAGTAAAAAGGRDLSSTEERLARRAGEVSGRVALRAPGEPGCFVAALCVPAAVLMPTPASPAAQGPACGDDDSLLVVLFATDDVRVARAPPPQAAKPGEGAAGVGVQPGSTGATCATAAAADDAAADVTITEELYDEAGAPTAAGMATTGATHESLLRVTLSAYRELYHSYGLASAQLDATMSQVADAVSASPVISLVAMRKAVREQAAARRAQNH
jgi:hypothetical protein